MLRPLVDVDERLDEDIGRLLAFGGRIGAQQAWESLRSAVEENGHTALGGALRLTLVTQRLRPPIDPQTGARPAPDLSEARELLADTCTDSGVAALKWQLLQRHAGGVPAGLTNRAETSASAWPVRGMGRRTPRGDTMKSRIEVASLGERRPLDFEASREAHDMNRRVEILIERRDDATEQLPPSTRIASRCP